MSEINSVVETNDYSQFRFIKLNRHIDETHLKRLTKDIFENGLSQPILVDAEGNILEGQHRFLACKSLGLNVKYIVTDDISIDRVVAINNLSKPWTPLDKARSYAAQGNEHYIKLLDFLDECQELEPKVSLRIASMLAQGSASKEVAMSRLHALTQFRRWDFYLKSNFVTAFLRCLRTMDDFDWKTLLERAENNPHLFVHAASTQEFLRVFETVYNYRRRTHLRFF
jgi:hypothetical protein